LYNRNGGNVTVAYESLLKAISVGVQTTYDSKIRDFWRTLQIYSYQLSRIFELLYAAKLCELEILDITLMDTDHILEDI
jgi:predicted phosphoadenosine phosphosulfate sulfurtransferase